MARIAIRVKRVTSLFKFLRYGRGLADYTGGMEVILFRRWPDRALIDTLPLMRGGSAVSFDLPPEFNNSIRVHIFGSELNQGDLFFELGTRFQTTSESELFVEGLPGRDPTVRLTGLTIAFVDDWIEALSRLQQELEADAGDHQSLLSIMQIEPHSLYDKAAWQNMFSTGTRPWTGVGLSNIIDADRVDGTVVMHRDGLKVDMALRKPNGRRFGRAKFDFKLEPERVSTDVIPRVVWEDPDVWGNFDQVDNSWRRISRWQVPPLEIDFSRPGLRGLPRADRDALNTFFQDHFAETLETLINRNLASGQTAIPTIWSQLKRFAPVHRRYLLPDDITVYQRSLGHRVRRKIMSPDGRVSWTSVPCYRPRLSSAIEILRTDPPARGQLVPAARRRRSRKR